jgi:hypothetical protein
MVGWNSGSDALEIQAGEPHSYATDIFQVGELLNDDSIIRIIGSGVKFRSRLMNIEPINRSTAIDALQDPWLMIV